MFAIGDERWPGISKLVEESGEVLQVCGKLVWTHGDVTHFDGSNLKSRLETELGDLLAAIAFVIAKNHLCFRCNTALGGFKDCIWLLKMALDYLGWPS